MRSSSATAIPALWLLAAWAALPCAGSARAAVPPRVAIVKSSSIAPFEEATSAIVGVLRAQPPQPEILTFDLEGDAKNGAAVFARVRETEPALVIPVGSLATFAALDSDVPAPIVFSMVLYPRESGLLGRAQRQVTGVTLDVPLQLQFATVRRLFPAARKVGVLYNEEETGSLVREAASVATALDLTLVPVQVDEPAAAVAKLSGAAAQIDVLWTVADSRVLTPQTTSALLLASLRRGLPVMGLSTAHVRAGAVAAVYCDYADIGQQTAEMALRVLRGEKPSDIPPAPPRTVRLALNRRTADHLGIHLTPEIEREAAEVVR